MRSNRDIWWLVLALGSGLVACSGDSGADAPLPGLWQISHEPILSIGSSTPLHRVAAAVRLSGGHIAVADGGMGSSRVTLFSPEGELMGILGRPGDGPGEFRTITSLQLGPRDSLIVFDDSRQRLTVFRPGQADPRVETFRPRPGVADGERLGAVRRLSDQIWVGREEETPIWGLPGTISRDTMAVGLMDPSLETFRALDEVPGVMSTVYLRGGQRILTLPAFSPNLLSTTWGSCVFLSAGDTSLVSVYSATGDLINQFHGPGRPRPVQQEHLDTLLAAQVRTLPQEAWPRVRQGIEEAARTSHLPYYHQMIVDEWGQVWLQEYEPPRGLGDRWFVLSQSGRVLGEVMMPKPLRVFSITSAGILGESHGPLDEDYVELFGLSSRPPEVASPLTSCMGTG